MWDKMGDIKFKGKVVGVLRDDRVFITQRKEEHFFHKFNGLGISYDVIQRLRALNCRRIVILYHGQMGTSKLTATPERFYKQGILWNFTPDDVQAILQMKFFDVVLPEKEPVQEIRLPQKISIKYKEQQKNKKLEVFA